MSVKHRVTRAFGGLIFGAEILVLIVLAYLSASGNVDALFKYIPNKLLTPQALLVYMLAGLILLKYGSSDTPDVSSLHEANTRLHNKIADLESQLQQRRLTDTQHRAITSALQAGIAKLWSECREAGLSEKGAHQPMAVRLIAIGTERETLMYRADFVKAFEVGGFKVALSEWPSTGTPEFGLFVGAVTVLQEDPRNVVRPFILDALRAAGIAPREAEFLPVARGGVVTSSDVSAQVVTTLVIGYRG